MSKKYNIDKTAKEYIISVIDNSSYSDIKLETTADKIKFLHKTFYAEHGWAVEQMGEQAALKEWFMGLPSSCNVEYRNHRILKLAEEWGSLPADATETQENRIIDNWFNLVAAKTGQLFRGYHVPKQEDKR